MKLSMKDYEKFANEKVSSEFRCKVICLSSSILFTKARIEDFKSRRSTLSKKILKGSEDKKTNKQLKEVVKYLTQAINDLEIELNKGEKG